MEKLGKLKIFLKMILAIRWGEFMCQLRRSRKFKPERLKLLNHPKRKKWKKSRKRKRKLKLPDKLLWDEFLEKMLTEFDLDVFKFFR